MLFLSIFAAREKESIINGLVCVGAGVSMTSNFTVLQFLITGSLMYELEAGVLCVSWSSAECAGGDWCELVKFTIRFHS